MTKPKRMKYKDKGFSQRDGRFGPESIAGEPCEECGCRYWKDDRCKQCGHLSIIAAKRFLASKATLTDDERIKLRKLDEQLHEPMDPPLTEEEQAREFALAIETLSEETS